MAENVPRSVEKQLATLQASVEANVDMILARLEALERASDSHTQSIEAISAQVNSIATRFSFMFDEAPTAMPPAMPTAAPPAMPPAMPTTAPPAMPPAMLTAAPPAMPPAMLTAAPPAMPPAMPTTAPPAMPPAMPTTAPREFSLADVIPDDAFESGRAPPALRYNIDNLGDAPIEVVEQFFRLRGNDMAK
jgi:hypothetical protein